MSKNVVDAVISVAEEAQEPLGLIPSRRQIDYMGGYSNAWKTADWHDYIKDRTSLVLLERDHGGPQQGAKPDYGFDSFYDDCKYMDIIHVDPWKAANSFEDGVAKTMDYMDFCYRYNDKILFEVGTEQSIFKYEAHELDFMLKAIKYKKPHLFYRIVYAVVQSGTSIVANTNTGKYSEKRLKDMVDVCREYEVLSKEHNGDYQTLYEIKNKFNVGLDAINIAPEFGKVETDVILKNIKVAQRKDLFERYFWLCCDSRKWVKWFPKNFNPILEKQKVIEVSGHYVLSDYAFSEIKNTFDGIDDEIQKALKAKINGLLNAITGC